jgi:prevent-host-death family protein
MLHVSVTAFRKHVPDYLGKVQKGEDITLTSRGKAVARLVPPLDERLMAMEQLAELRGTVLKYDDPFEPAVPPDEWEVLK